MIRSIDKLLAKVHLTALQAIIISLILVSSIIIRFYELSSIPFSISHDELYYTIQAAYIRHLGTDPTGDWHPWYLTAAHPLYAELPGLVLSAGYWFSDNTLFAPRIVSSTIGILLGLAIGWLTWLLTRSTRTGLFAVVLTLANPWFIQNSRMAFDPLLSIFFYVIATCIFLASRAKWRLISLPFFFLAFFQYQGMKLLLVPLVLGLVVFSYDTQKTVRLNLRKNWTGAVTLFVAILFTIFFIISVRSQSAVGRVGEMLPFQAELLGREVVAARTKTFDSPLLELYANKLTMLSTLSIERALVSLNPTRLYWEENSIRSPYAVYSHGVMYIIDGLLLLLGIYSLWRYHRRVSILTLYLVAVGLLPAVLNGIDIWPYFRASWILVPLIIISAVGLAAVKHKLLSAALLACYLLSLLHFGYIYFFQYPLLTTIDQSYSERIIASYIRRAQRLDGTTPIHIQPAETFFASLALIAHGQSLSKEVLIELQSKWKTANEKYENEKIVIQSKCPSEAAEGSNAILLLQDRQQSPCPGYKVNAVVLSPLDVSRQFSITNDTLCHQYNIRSYPTANRRMLDIDSLTDQEFCELFISRNE